MTTALVVGYQFGKWMDHTLGITKFISQEFGDFGSAIDSVADALEDNAEGMWNYTNASHRLAMAIGEVNLAHALADAQAAGNTRLIARLTAEIEKKANAYNRVHIEANGATIAEEEHADAQEDLKAATAEVAAEEAERLATLRKTHGLMTSDEVTDKMAEMTGHYKDHINNGVAVELVNKKFKADWEKLAELGKLYGIEVTSSFKGIGQSMTETGDLESNDFYKLLDYHIPKAVNLLPGKIMPGMVEISGRIATKLEGGFDKGFARGMNKWNAYDQDLQDALNATWKGGFAGFGDALRDEVNVILDQDYVVKLRPDQDDWDAAMRDVTEGKIPDTGG